MRSEDVGRQGDGVAYASFFAVSAYGRSAKRDRTAARAAVHGRAGCVNCPVAPRMGARA